jgi:UDP-glucose 4-epimerase
MAREGHDVNVLDSFATGRRENLEGLPRVRVIEGDLRDREAVRQAAAGCEGIFHVGALPSVVKSMELPLESHDVNVTGTLNVLEAARAAATKVVYVGSSSAYGNSATLPKREDMRELPLSPYAVSKLAGELYARSWSAVFGVPTVIVRFFNVFGPRQVPDSPYSGVIAKFVRCALTGEAPRIEGDGEQSRDFTFVDDAVEGLVLAMRTPVAPGSVFNIAGGERHSVNDLVASLARILDRPQAPVHVAPRTGDVKHSLADITKARTTLGYEPSVPFAEGLKKTVDWYRRLNS